MKDSARRIVKALGFTGLVGFDFMIEAATGAAYLIEMNPRCTPICAVPLGPGRDLAEALAARLAHRAPRERPAKTERDILRLLPGHLAAAPRTPFTPPPPLPPPWDANPMRS